MKYVNKRNVILAAIIFLSGLVAGGRLLAPKILPVPDKNAATYAVLKVIDGDTFYIDQETRVRLLGIDAPEKGACYYKESSQALKDLIEGQRVKLEKDITDKDIYGRLLRYAILVVDGGDNILINDYLVSHGFAFAERIPPDKHYRELLISGEEDARREKTGLWGACVYPGNDESDLRETDSAPDDPRCIIKGNISEKGFGKTYLLPGCDNYERVKIDPKKGEQYFCSEEEAAAAGFRRATN